jgi:hypothetical protein
MTTPAMTDQQLINYSGEHLMHELSMFWELADTLPQKKASTETSALVESFGVHLRNLIDFFYREGRGDDVTAQDFLDTITTWKPGEPAPLTKAHQRANKELNHLTQARISGSPPEKAWDTAALLKEIDTVAKEFATKASAKKLHPDVRKFLNLAPDTMLKWISDNVTHSNVALPLVSSHVFGASNSSTATQIVTKLPPK